VEKFVIVLICPGLVGQCGVWGEIFTPNRVVHYFVCRDIGDSLYFAALDKQMYVYAV
jgi:hypothetical protein